MTIVEFLTARLDEAEADIDGDPYDAQYRDLKFGLADIAAKRAIIEWCSERDQIWVGTAGDDPDAAKPNDFVPGSLTHRIDSVVLRFLASVYAEHPDYRADWKP